MLKLIARLFKKEPKAIDPYVYMGSLGISPKHMTMYQESVNKIKVFEESHHNKS